MMVRTSNERFALAVLTVLVLDQASKLLVLNNLGYAHERVIWDGFFKFVHWGNTGAAWSLFRDNNGLLTIISLVVSAALMMGRKKFAPPTPAGDYTMGMVLGGIVGNTVDRLAHGHVVDFLYFYLRRRSGDELGFPAFNVADSAICVGVFLLLLYSVSAGNDGEAARKTVTGENERQASG